MLIAKFCDICMVIAKFCDGLNQFSHKQIGPVFAIGIIVAKNVKAPFIDLRPMELFRHKLHSDQENPLNVRSQY